MTMQMAHHWIQMILVGSDGISDGVSLSELEGTSMTDIPKIQKVRGLDRLLMSASIVSYL